MLRAAHHYAPAQSALPRPAPPTCCLAAGVQGCMGVLKIVSDAVAVCLQSGCKTIDLSDPVSAKAGLP